MFSRFLRTVMTLRPLPPPHKTKQKINDKNNNNKNDHKHVKAECFTIETKTTTTTFRGLPWPENGSNLKRNEIGQERGNGKMKKNGRKKNGKKQKNEKTKQNKKQQPIFAFNFVLVSPYDKRTRAAFPASLRFWQHQRFMSKAGKVKEF